MDVESSIEAFRTPSAGERDGTRGPEAGLASSLDRRGVRSEPPALIPARTIDVHRSGADDAGVVGPAALDTCCGQEDAQPARDPGCAVRQDQSYGISSTARTGTRQRRTPSAGGCSQRNPVQPGRLLAVASPRPQPLASQREATGTNAIAPQYGHAGSHVGG